MEFCPKCGTILVPKLKHAEVRFHCVKCEYVGATSKKTVKIFGETEQAVYVVEKEKPTGSKPNKE